MAQISQQRARQVCEAAHPGRYIGLRSPAPFGRLLPSPTGRLSPELVVRYVECFISHVVYSMRLSKAAGYYMHLFDRTTDPTEAGLAFHFESPEHLYRVICRLNRGALVDPTRPRILNTFCGADGRLSGELYDLVAPGRNFHDLLFAVVLRFVDEEGIQQLHVAHVY